MSKKIPESQKLGKFYDFTVTEERFNKVQQLSNKKLFKNFRNAFILGFLVEAMIVRTKIYDNIVRTSITKRLESKLKEDENLRERRILQQRREEARSAKLAMNTEFEKKTPQ